MLNNEQIDSLIDAESQALLSGIGNHEAKTLVAAVINTQPTLRFSVRQLEREMVTRQGEVPSWRINSGTVADYVSDCLLPIGAVAREEEAYGTRTKKVYSASEFGIERGLPFAGAIMEWSLAYPDNSVQKLLGITAVAGQATRAPIASYSIMQELVTHPGNTEINIASLSRSIGDGNDLRIANDHLLRLEGEKLVELRTVVQDYNPIYKIDREKAISITLSHAISNAIRESWLGAPTDEMTLDQLLAITSEKYPNLASNEIRHWMTYVVPKQRLPFLEVIDRNGAPISQSDAKLTDKGREIIGALVEAIEASQNDEQQNFRNLAVEVVSDADKFRTLMNKAKASSGFASKLLSKNVILEEVQSAGEITVTQLREALATKGIKVGTASVRRYLTVMTEEGVLQTQLAPLSNSLKRTVVHYRTTKNDQ